MLVIEEPLFAVHSTSITAELAIGIDDSVAGNDKCELVGPICRGHSAVGCGPSDFSGDLGIRCRGAVGNLQQLFPNPFLKGGAQEKEGNLGAFSLPIEPEFFFERHNQWGRRPGIIAIAFSGALDLELESSVIDKL